MMYSFIYALPCLLNYKVIKKMTNFPFCTVCTACWRTARQQCTPAKKYSCTVRTEVMCTLCRSTWLLFCKFWFNFWGSISMHSNWAVIICTEQYSTVLTLLMLYFMLKSSLNSCNYRVLIKYCVFSLKLFYFS